MRVVAIAAAFAGLGLLACAPRTAAPGRPATGNTIASFGILRPPLYLLWKKKAGRSPASEMCLTPEGLVVASTDNTVRLVDFQEGDTVWKRKLTGTPSTPPARTGDRIVIGHLIPEPGLVALSASSGERLWTVRDLRPRGGIAARNDTLFVGGVGRFYAVSAATGDRFYDVPTPGRWPAPFALSGWNLVLATERDSVGAWDTRDGTRRWSVAFPGGSRGGVIASGDTAFVVGTKGRLVALDVPTGREIWTNMLPSSVYGAPCQREGSLIIDGLDGSLFAVSSETGEIAWTVRLAGASRAAPAIIGDTIVVTTLDAACQLVSRAERRVIHTVDIERPSRTSPLVRGNKLYAIDESGHVYAYESS